MDKKMLADCGVFPFMLLLTGLAAVMLPAHFCGLSFHLYHIVAVLIGFLPLLSHRKGTQCTGKELRDAVLGVLLLTAILTASVACIPSEDSIYLARDSHFSVHPLIIAVEPGYIEFGRLETGSQLAVMLGMFSLLPAGLSLPFLACGRKGGFRAACVGVLFNLLFQYLFRLDSLNGHFFAMYTWAMLLPAAAVAAAFVYSAHRAAALCRKQPETEVQT